MNGLTEDRGYKWKSHSTRHVLSSYKLLIKEVSVVSRKHRRLPLPLTIHHKYMVRPSYKSAHFACGHKKKINLKLTAKLLPSWLSFSVPGCPMKAAGVERKTSMVLQSPGPCMLQYCSIHPGYFPAWTAVHLLHEVLLEARRGHQILGTKNKGCCEQPYKCLELNPGPLEEQSVLLIPEPSL